MKKTVKIISTILLAIMLLTSISTVALAKVDLDKTLQGVESATGGDGEQIATVGGNIVNIIQIVGIVVAVIVLLVIGIKYMIGSASEKAEYKKTMIPYLVGAVLIFASTTIVNVVYNIANGFNATK